MTTKSKQESSFIVIMVIASYLVTFQHAPLTIFFYCLVMWILLCICIQFNSYRNNEEQPTTTTTDNTSHRDTIIAVCCILFFIVMIIYLHIIK